MSLNTLPLLFVNLGGEMVYILDQRLRAQNISAEKARRVMHDIVGTMLNRRFMEELFKPQELYSKKAVRTVFDRLAHASIMRLNAASMDKLYDLMTMAFKYQVSLCLRPNDILLTTLNHLDAILKFVEEIDIANEKARCCSCCLRWFSHFFEWTTITSQVEYVYELLIETYGSLSDGDFHLIRQTILNFFQDMHIRVSIFLKDKVQNSNGRFVIPTNGQVPHKTEVPGTIKYFDEKGSPTYSESFTPGSHFNDVQLEGSYDLHGPRRTNLGTNMYSASRIETTVSPAKTVVHSSDLETSAPNPLAKAQLDLLSSLLSVEPRQSENKTEFRLNLFNTDEEEEEASAGCSKLSDEEGSLVITIDASKKNKNPALNKVMADMTVEDQCAPADKGDDLLQLMDGL